MWRTSNSCNAELGNSDLLTQQQQKPSKHGSKGKGAAMIMKKYSATQGKLVTMYTGATFTPGAFSNPAEVNGA